MSEHSALSYRSSAASLFSCAARQSAVITVCDWCGEPGSDKTRNVDGFNVPDDHDKCKRDVLVARAFCLCFEFIGDNCDCPTHGGR